MKQILLSLAAIICMPLCAWCAAALPPAHETPQTNTTVQEDPRAWDFGSARAGEVLEHEFVLTNNSGQDLVIKDTTTSCGCTASGIKKKHLKPGESTTVSVKFDTKGYSGDSKQFVYVNTDNIDEPVIRFTVRAHISK
jgi:hypothetical protein